MSDHELVSDQDSPIDPAPESDRENIEEDYYIPDHTDSRPPYLIHENFSSTQPNGSNTQPRPAMSIETDNAIPESRYVTDGGDGNYTYTPSMVYTESTLRADDPLVARPDLAYVVNHNYYSLGGNSGGLTVQAMAAHDRNNENAYNSIYGWEPHQVGYNNFHADSGYDLSTGYMMSSSGTRSKASTTTNNYVFVPPTPEDPSAEIIRDVGGWQADTPAPPASSARDIADEDIVGA